MIEFEIKYAIIACILFGLFYLLIRHKIDLMQATFFLIPFNQIYFNVGLNLSAFLFFIILLWISELFHKETIYFNNVFFITFILYSVCITLLIGLLYVNETRALGGFFRSEGRIFSQIILFLILFSLVPLMANYIKNIDDITKYLKSFFIGLLILSLLGILQWLVYTILTIDIFPLSLRDGEALSGKDVIMGQIFFRVSSLGGEPKGFAISLAIGLAILHILNKNKIKIFKNDGIVKTLYFVSLLFTLSTSGYLLFLILLTIVFMTSFNKINTLNKKSFSYYMLTFFTILSIVVIYHEFIYSVVEKRLLSRSLTSEDFDLAVKLFLYDQPYFSIFGVGMGNVHNFAFEYIPAEFSHYMSNSIFTAKSGYLKLVSEVGIIGTILFVTYHIQVFYLLHTKNINSNYPNIYKASSIILIIILLSYLARVYSINIYIALFALISVVAYKDFNRKVST